MTEFEELPDLDALAGRYGLEIDDSTDRSTLLSLILQAPQAAEYVVTRTEIPPDIPGVLQMLVPRTRIFVNIERSRQFWGDAMVAIAVYAMTQSTPAAFFATTVRKVYDNLSILDSDESEVVRDLLTLSGGNPYHTAILEDDLRVRFAETNVPLNDVLDRLERKGIVAKRRGGKLVLVF